MNTRYLIPIAFCLLSSSAHAELTNCNGSWTNKPCEGVVGASITERPLDPRLTAKDYPEKAAIIATAATFAHELTRSRVYFPMAEFRAQCLSLEQPAENCRATFVTLKAEFEQKAKDELERRRIEMEQVKSHKEREEMLLAIESARAEAEQAKNYAAQTSGELQRANRAAMYGY